jgi:hypothetical protein
LYVRKASWDWEDQSLKCTLSFPLSLSASIFHGQGFAQETNNPASTPTNQHPQTQSGAPREVKEQEHALQLQFPIQQTKDWTSSSPKKSTTEKIHILGKEGGQSRGKT